jgi:iron complex outermembrane receptor protein
MADYQGAGYENAPLKFSKSFATPLSIPNVIAGTPVTVPDVYGDDRESWRSRAKIKLHTQYTKGDFDLWVRYTQGGEKATPQRGDFALPPFGGRPLDFDYDTEAAAFQFGYVQFTVFGRYLWELSECLNMEMRLSYDSMDFSRFTESFLDRDTGLVQPAGPNNPHREEEYYGRVMLNWTPNESHASAFGMELSRHHLGLRAWSFPDDPAAPIIQSQSGITDSPWWTTAYAFIGEHQWKISDSWTMFLTGRFDNHSFTTTLFSPRGAIICTPDEVNTFKFIATESVRRLPEDVLFGDVINNRGRSDVESIESLELRYERRPSEALLMAASGFYQESEFVGLSGLGNSNQGQFADVAMWGVELEASYRSDDMRIIASHSYTKLIEFELVGPFALPDPFDLADPFFVQRISAAPYGFGNDMANQSPHLSKFALHYDHCCHWASDMSLRIYWGFPGDEDLTEFDNARFAATGSDNRVSDPGFLDAFQENIYLNYALQYQPNDRLTARLELFNILGWFDRDLNKRNFIFQPTTYRSEAPALGILCRLQY